MSSFVDFSPAKIGQPPVDVIDVEGRDVQTFSCTRSCAARDVFFLLGALFLRGDNRRRMNFAFPIA
jgi:hypothetical protein